MTAARWRLMPRPPRDLPGHRLERERGLLLSPVLALACAAASTWLLAVAVRDLPVGTAHAVWTGIGAVGTALFGIALPGEPPMPARVAGIAAIAGGIVTPKLALPS